MSTHIPTPEEQFIIYYDKLREEINKAYTHHEICKSLRAFSSTHRAEFSEALLFFRLTIDAHLFVTIMSIGRFIDTRSDSLQLDLFFKFVKDNLNLFSTESYKKRLLDTGRNIEECEYWAKKHINITEWTVDKDNECIKKLPISNLRQWRHKKLAHLDEQLVLMSVDIMKESPVTIQEIDDVINTIHEVLDRYRIAYDGTQWKLGLPPVEHQIKYIIDAIKSYRLSRKD